MLGDEGSLADLPHTATHSTYRSIDISLVKKFPEELTGSENGSPRPTSLSGRVRYGIFRTANGIGDFVPEGW